MKSKLNQRGAAHLLLLLAAAGLLTYVVFSSSLPFKDQLFSYLYPKPQSQAASDVSGSVRFVDKSGATVITTTSPSVTVRAVVPNWGVKAENTTSTKFQLVKEVKAQAISCSQLAEECAPEGRYRSGECNLEGARCTASAPSQYPECGACGGDPSHTYIVNKYAYQCLNGCNFDAFSCLDQGRKPGECGNPSSTPAPTVTPSPTPTLNPTPIPSTIVLNCFLCDGGKLRRSGSPADCNGFTNRCPQVSGPSSVCVSPSDVTGQPCSVKPLPTITPKPTIAPKPVTTIGIILAEDPRFTRNVLKMNLSRPVAPGVYQSNYVFSNPTPGIKTLFVKFYSSNGQVRQTSTSINLLAPKSTNTFSNLSADAPLNGPAVFKFSYNGTIAVEKYTINVSTTPNMSTDVYQSFAGGTQSPLVLTDPKKKWDKYSCGKTLYWVIVAQPKGQTFTVKSPIQSFVVKCPAPTSTPTPTPTSLEVGLEAGSQSDTSMVNVVADSGAKWVRVNFIIRCNGNENISYPACSWSNSQSDINTYNQIINAYLQKGIKVYGLIGAESVKGPPNQSGYDRSNPGQFTDKFVDTADAIVTKFGDRVKVFEIFNEPNDWAGGNDAQMPASYFAQNLAKVYQKIKIDRNRRDISLISGPIVSFDNSSSADYLSQTYQEGLNSADWRTIKSKTGSYPLDGIGYHIYVAQGADAQSSVEPNLRENLDAIKAIINREDPGKKIWISEFGWGTRGGSVSEKIQADNLTKAYSLFKTRPEVKMAMWFTIQDFGDPAEFGLRHGDGVPKDAWSAFQAIAKASK